MSDVRRHKIQQWSEIASEYRLLRELHLVPNSLGETANWELRLTLLNHSGDQSRTVHFEGVVDFTVNDLRLGERVGPIELEDLRARGWQDIRYRFSDREPDERITFSCVDFWVASTG